MNDFGRHADAIRLAGDEEGPVVGGRRPEAVVITREGSPKVLPVSQRLAGVGRDGNRSDAAVDDHSRGERDGRSEVRVAGQFHAIARSLVSTVEAKRRAVFGDGLIIRRPHGQRRRDFQIRTADGHIAGNRPRRLPAAHTARAIPVPSATLARKPYCNPYFLSRIVHSRCREDARGANATGSPFERARSLPRGGAYRTVATSSRQAAGSMNPQ